MTHTVSRADRAEMMRAHVGIVTAHINDDPEAKQQQLRVIMADQLEKSGGDVTVAVGRLVKQVEAGALVTYTVLRSLATRLGLSDQEAVQAFAEALNVLDEDTFPE